MKNILKTLIPLATGLVVGVVVGRVKNKQNLISISKNGISTIFSKNGLKYIRRPYLI